jgi:hypothetical protein
MKKPLLITFIAVLMMPLGLVAQEEGADEAPPPLTSTWTLLPKKGMEAEFAEAAAAEIKARAEKGESRQWFAYRPVVGDNLAVVHYRACCFNWADEDAAIAEDAELGLGESWGENVGPYVDHYHHHFERADWENSHWPDTGTSGPLFGVTTWQWKQGVGPGPGQAREKLSQIGINDGWASDENNWLWFSRIGGAPQLSIVSSFENYADMEPPEQSFFEFIKEQIGEEEAGALFAQFGAGFASSDYTVWRLDTDLSSPSGDEE